MTNTLRSSLRDMKRAARTAEREINEALSEALSGGTSVFNRSCRLARRICNTVKRRLVRADRPNRASQRRTHWTRPLARTIHQTEMEVFA